LNYVKFNGIGQEVFIQIEDGREFVRALISVRTRTGPNGYIEVKCDDPVIVNRFRNYASARVLFTVGELRWTDGGEIYVAADILDYSRPRTHTSIKPGFKVFNSALPIEKFVQR
jgi:hypothetical protein